jgi:transcriptional regulator with AAA-type ATPase domain
LFFAVSIRLWGKRVLTKRIGEYLLEEQICNEQEIALALNKQATLREEGIFKPLGLVLINDIGVAIKDVDRCLQRMHIDVLSSASIFKDLSKDSIVKTVAIAEQQVLPEDTIIFNQGDLAETFCVVISGEVMVYLVSGDGKENILTTLKSGEGFGEMALLTGEPRSASVKTLKPTSLLVLSKNYFDQLCLMNPDISMAFIKLLADRLTQSNVEIVSASEKERAYQQFVSQQDELSMPEVVGQSKSINRLRKSIALAAENSEPVLVAGEPGTEKLVVAGSIHKSGHHASHPFLSMNAGNASLNGSGGVADIGDTDFFQLEMAQSSMLFGHEQGAFPQAETRRLGLLQIGRQGTVVIENIDRLTPGVQQQLLEFLDTKTFKTIGGTKQIHSSSRIIGTTSADLAGLIAEGKFAQKLYDALSAITMDVPPLRKRKGDLRLLVDFIIIMECFTDHGRKLIKGISPEAYQRVMEYDWPGNMDDLHVVIRRAINLTRGDYLMPEDIFVGMAPPTGKYTFNLLNFDQVRNFFKSRFYPVGIQTLTASVFSVIFLLAFLGNQKPDHNVSLLLVWAMWWPMLTVSWFLGARIWCSVCPMGAVNDLLNRFCSLKKKVPKFIRNYSIYLTGAGLAFIIYVEAASHMTHSPMATGFLLLGIASFAILSGSLYERRVWCRYLCPLGRLAGTFAGCSVIEWRSNASICNSTCKTNACYKGTADVPGCPLYQGAFSLRNNQECILCGNCVKICENGSPACNLRVPGHELWAALKPEKVTSIFVPVILGTQVFRGLEHTAFAHGLEQSLHSTWAAFAILLIAAIGISFLFTRAAGTLSFGRLKDKTINKGDLFINAVIPLAFSFEFSYQLSPLLERLGEFFPVLGREFGVDMEFLNLTAEHGSAKPWQVFSVLIGMVVSMVFLKILIKNHQETREDAPRSRRLRYVPILLLAGVYIWMFVTG